jgi:hypothetical protein
MNITAILIGLKMSQLASEKISLERKLVWLHNVSLKATVKILYLSEMQDGLQ